MLRLVCTHMRLGSAMWGPSRLQAASPAIAFALLSLLALLARLPGARAGPLVAKCSACQAVAEALAARLDKEVPRNHLDLQHRLDKDGKRYGRVIDYKLSELRVIHLLEGLCDEMKKYELVEEGGEGAARWARTDSLPANRHFNALIAKEKRKLLENFCHDVLELFEDDLSAALRAAEFDADSASDWLCHKTARHCDEPLPTREEAAGEGQPQPGGAGADAAAGSSAGAEL